MPEGKKKDRERWLRGVGQAIRECRTAAGLSQEELGHRAGLHRTYVSDLERGRRNPTAMTLQTLANTLGTRPSLLLAAAERISDDYVSEPSLLMRVAER